MRSRITVNPVVRAIMRLCGQIADSSRARVLRAFDNPKG